MFNSTLTGIAIYTQVAYNYWYKYAFEVKKSQPNNVLYLCMKDIQRNIPEAVAKIKAFRDGKTYPNDSNNKKRKIYNGKHSTSKNETLRQKIRDIVQKVDKNVMGSKLADGQRLYNCSPPQRPEYHKLEN